LSATTGKGIAPGAQRLLSFGIFLLVQTAFAEDQKPEGQRRVVSELPGALTLDPLDQQRLGVAVAPDSVIRRGQVVQAEQRVGVSAVRTAAPRGCKRRCACR